MSRPALRMIEGGKDIVEFCEGLLEQARAGEFTALAVATVEGPEEDVLGMGYAYRDDMDHAFARILASVTSLQAELLENGI